MPAAFETVPERRYAAFSFDAPGDARRALIDEDLLGAEVTLPSGERIGQVVEAMAGAPGIGADSQAFVGAVFDSPAALEVATLEESDFIVSDGRLVLVVRDAENIEPDEDEDDELEKSAAFLLEAIRAPEPGEPEPVAKTSGVSGWGRRLALGETGRLDFK